MSPGEEEYWRNDTDATQTRRTVACQRSADFERNDGDEFDFDDVIEFGIPSAASVDEDQQADKTMPTTSPII